MEIDIFNTDKKYTVIYADPPWNFGSKELQKYSGQRFRSLNAVYQTEKTASMEQWDVGRIADKDCAIFMWSTDAHIKEAINLMEAWGFKHVTIAFIWQKVTNKGKQVSNLGAWTMKNCEICLFGTRGGYAEAQEVEQREAAFQRGEDTAQQEARLRARLHRRTIRGCAEDRTFRKDYGGRLGRMGERSRKDG